MGDLRRHLEITAEEWGAFMDDLRQTLNKFVVPTRRARRADGEAFEHLPSSPLSSQPTTPSSYLAAPIGDTLTEAGGDLPPQANQYKERDDRRVSRFVVAVPGEVNDG
jgi:hypothetical protein